MKLSEYYLPTLKEEPADAEIPSHRLMLRAGMIRKLSAGVYTYLPLGYRVIKKIQSIVREEMDRKGCQELLMPAMQTSEIWKESERWEDFGPLMIRFEDRQEREYCLGPTHEEVVADLIRDEIKSYKKLPYNLYQIQTKVRDEIRPRFGLMRAREFIMKDAYSLDLDFEGLDESYQDMYEAYSRVFERCGLDTRVVEADTGAMGGKDSHEFMVLADSGEDDLAFCTECEYAANVERATADFELEESAEQAESLEKVHTPGATTIEELESMLEVDSSQMVKTMAYFADEKPVVALVRGDDQLNEVKLRNYFEAVTLRPAEAEEFSEHFGSTAGFIGPVDLKDDVEIVADRRIQNMSSAVTGANERDYHLFNVEIDRDVEGLREYTDLREVKEGDSCPKCGAKLEIKAGIEVGHIFKLGTKYSESMGATYLDENGSEKPIVMGSYGIGISRLAAAAIEQNHDDKGIVWPKPLAPFQVVILALGNSDEVEKEAEKLYQELQAEGVETLLDDRDERAGVKFNDAELIGIPLQVIVGSRSLSEGKIEVEFRESGEECNIDRDGAAERLTEMLDDI